MKKNLGKRKGYANPELVVKILVGGIAIVLVWYLIITPILCVLG